MSPLTTKSTVPPTRVLVRYGFTDHDVWRKTFGDAEFLHAASCDGSLDAKEWTPAGSMESSMHGPRLGVTFR